MAKEKEIGGMNMEEVRNSPGKLVCRVEIEQNRRDSIERLYYAYMLFGRRNN